MISFFKVLAILTIFLIIVSVFLFKTFSQFGHLPGNKKTKEWKNLPNYSLDKKEFLNQIPNVLDIMKKESNMLESLKEWLRKDIDRRPQSKLPNVESDLVHFLKKETKLKVIWLGHSSLLINIDNKIILIDPVLTKSASPFEFMVQRFQKPPLELDQLPSIDYIIITHDHYDHLDMESVKFFKDKEVTFITPLGVESHLESWGISSHKIITKNWWESFDINGLKITCTPAQHFSGRDGLNVSKTLWASWVIQSKDTSIYLSGDSGYSNHFKEIGDKLGPFDLAFLENGQYNKNWKSVHMFPSETVTASIDLKAKSIYPIHWGMFELALHKWDEPIIELFKFAKEKNVNLITPKLGEVYDLENQYLSKQWWIKK
jgi:L-ascorbate metabolism protein UlaG (beta-lactamase superfamily)